MDGTCENDSAEEFASNVDVATLNAVDDQGRQRLRFWKNRRDIFKALQHFLRHRSQRMTTWIGTDWIEQNLWNFETCRTHVNLISIWQLPKEPSTKSDGLRYDGPRSRRLAYWSYHHLRMPDPRRDRSLLSHLPQWHPHRKRDSLHVSLETP